MKVLVFGKGGSGKSTVATFLANTLAKRGFRVLVVDMDESNTTLYRMLGIEPPRTTLVDYLGGRRKIVDALFRKQNEIDWTFAEKGLTGLPEECTVWRGDLGLLVVGKITGFGEGCACPLNALAREFLKRIKLSDFECVLVDTDAGVEHFGRGVEEACDLLLMVVDPTYESIVMAEKAEKFAHKAGKRLYLILNKVDERSKQILLGRLPREKVIAAIPYRGDWVEKSLLGEPLGEPPREIEEVASLIMSPKETP